MSDAVALLLTASLRVTVVLTAAWLITLMLRRSSASARHMVWACAIGAAVLTPLLSQIPSWPVRIPDTVTRWSHWADATHTPYEIPLVEPASIAADATSNAATPTPDPTEPAGPSSVTYIAAIWSAGFVTVLLYLLMGIAAALRLRTHATRAHATWIDDGRVLARSVGVERVAFAESAHAPVPFVCGVVNPLVVMPPAVSGWDADRRRIVLLHELSHVKRRDCLTHLLAQIACAIYWFLPLSWFAAHRLRVESEQACDDVVLAAGVRGSDYAHHLVAVAKASLPRSSLLASTGVAMAHRSQLEGRLMVILDPTTCRTTPRLARLGTVSFALLALGVASLRLQAQAPTHMPSVSSMPANVVSTHRNQAEETPPTTVSLEESPINPAVRTSQPAPVPAPPQSSATPEDPSFEVSSIKRKEPGMARLRFDPGRIRMEGPLVMLIGIAYDGGPVRGGPSWLRSDDYSVEARAATDAPRSEIVKMLRSLLRERLNLAIHRETHEEDAFTMVVARDGQLGPQLRKSSVDCAARIAAVRNGQEIPDLPQLPNGMPPCISRPRSGDLVTGGMTMDALAAYVGGEVGRRVINKTGLDGYYEMSLRHREETVAGGDSDLPTVFTALSEQLGLRLHSARTTVETIVIDRVERPTEN